MNREALITGAGGFVGRILHQRLAERGWTVRCCDVHVPPGEPGWFACDVSDSRRVDALMAWCGEKISHVFHLAAITFVPETGRNPYRAFDVNLQGTVLLADAVRRAIPSARLVFIGSAEVYGPPQSLPMDERHPINPTNPYAISKAAADLYCGYLHAAGLLDVVRVRPFNHSGPGQADSFVLSSFARQIARIEAGKVEPILRVGNLDARRDFSHVSDVVRAYEALAVEGVSGEVYNVCSGAAVSIREALALLLDMAAVPIRVEQDAGRMRPVDVPELWGSHEKLTARTGWLPEISFGNLLGDLLEYWRLAERA